MGCISSIRSERRVSPAARKYKNRITILMLGTASTGKSTIIKQMKILHKNGFSTIERKHYNSLVVGNLTESMHAIIDIINSKTELEFCDSSSRIKSVYFEAMVDELLRGNYELTIDIVPLIRELLRDPVIMRCFHEYRHLVPNAEAADYFFKQIERVCLIGYIPTSQDILHVRLSTTRPTEFEFEYDLMNVMMVDVGGQRTQRNKWVHCFEGVHAILFCVSLNEYAMDLAEDATTNAMEESLRVFAWAINNKWLHMKPVVLFLNKMDLFEKIIKRVPISRSFPDYRGAPLSYDDGITFIKQMYLAKDVQPNRRIYTHVTCATNTKNIDTVFCAAINAMIHDNMANYGLL